MYCNMATQKFEVYGSFKGNAKGIDTYLLSSKVISLTYSQLLEAVCLHQHKEGAKEGQCIGYRISDKGLDLYFEK
jgi:hypothetical protein